MTTFEQIKKLSDERKISLKDLANKLGFGENYFYNMKNAKSSPSSEVLKKALQSLDCKAFCIIS